MYMIMIYRYNRLIVRELFFLKEEMLACYKEWPWNIPRDDCSVSLWQEVEPE